MTIMPIIRIFLIVPATLLVTACVSGSRNSASSTAISHTILTCVGAVDCQNKMNPARNWVANNTGFGDLGCPTSEEAAVDFNRAVSSAF